MKHLIALLVFCAVGLAASETRSGVDGEFWPSLAEMVLEERSNTELWLEPPRGSAPGACVDARVPGRA